MQQFNPDEVVRREQARWSLSAARFSDEELLRRRERLFNGLTMVFGLAILPTWFFGGSLGTVGLFFAIAAEIIAARYYNGLGNQCRDVRQTLTGRVNRPTNQQFHIDAIQVS